MADNSPAYKLANSKFAFGYGIVGTTYEAEFDKETEEIRVGTKDTPLDLSNLVTMIIWEQTVTKQGWDFKSSKQKKCEPSKDGLFFKVESFCPNSTELKV